MARNYQETIEGIKAKVRVAIDRQQYLLQANAAAKHEIEQLRETVRAQAQEIEKLRTEAEYLKLVTMISPSRDDVEHAREVFTELVRKIDRCITDLTE